MFGKVFKQANIVFFVKNMAKSAQEVVKASIRGLDDSWMPNYKGIPKTVMGTRGQDVAILYSTFKKSPEVVACLTAIVEDVVGDEWKYIGAERTTKVVENFDDRVDLFHLLANVVLELLITGNAYILKLSVSSDKINSLMEVLTKTIAKELQIKYKTKIEYLKQQLEAKKVPEDLQLLKSSTIKIEYDETGIVKGYWQEVDAKTRYYKAEDVIHISLLQLGGENYGFTQLEALLPDIATLIFAKDYAGDFFENDGTPGFIFKMPEDNPDSRNFKLLKDGLKQLKKKNEKYKNMVVTGKVDVEQVAKFTKDMEFSKLIQHFTQIILIGLGVPSHRVNYTITDGSSQAGSGVNRAYEGYWKKIGFTQRLIENQLNQKLFWPIFKVRLKFNRSYKIDEMREAQIAQILSQIGAVTIEEIREKIGYDPEMPKGTKPIVTGDQNNINFAQDKKREQGQDNNPKQPDAQNDNKTKDVQKSIADGVVEVDYSKFVTIVERYVGTGNFDKAKVLYIETEKEIKMFFNDNSWKYKCVVVKNSDNIDGLRNLLANSIPISTE